APIGFLDKGPGIDPDQLEADDVRFHSCGLDVDLRQSCQPLGEAPRVVVRLLQAWAMMFQCIQGAGGDDSGLAETAAELLLEPPGARDDLLRPGKAGSDGGAQSLGETHADRIEASSIVGLRNAGGCRGMPEPGPVEV